MEEFNWETFDHKTGKRTGRGYKMRTSEILEGGKLVCSLCSGKGILHGTRGTKCPVCRGSGEINMPGPVIKCVYCRGSGSYPARTNLTCNVCKGTGYVQIEKPFEVCDVCHGSGKSPNSSLPCIKCRGKGVLKIRK